MKGFTFVASWGVLDLHKGASTADVVFEQFLVDERSNLLPAPALPILMLTTRSRCLRCTVVKSGCCYVALALFLARATRWFREEREAENMLREWEEPEDAIGGRSNLPNVRLRCVGGCLRGNGWRGP